MSRAVGMVIEQLLSDERLRSRFARDRIETIAEPGLTGCELTPEELRTDAMSIRIDTLTKQESIVVTTRASVYELTVLRGDRGEVLVRGGSQFPEFRQACLLGSIADDGLFGPRTIGVGLRMKIVSGDVFVLTSPVRSFSRRSTSAVSARCATAR
jgi:hypothetical protein